MRIPYRKRGGELLLPMTPLIDVVFLLLIFFLVSNQLASQEDVVPVELPRISRGDKDVPSRTSRILVQVVNAHTIRVNKRKCNLDELPSLLQQEVVEGDKVELRLRCDRRIDYRSVERILRIASQVGIRDIQLAVMER